MPRPETILKVKKVIDEIRKEVSLRGRVAVGKILRQNNLPSGYLGPLLSAKIIIKLKGGTRGSAYYGAFKTPVTPEIIEKIIGWYNKDRRSRRRRLRKPRPRLKKDHYVEIKKLLNTLLITVNELKDEIKKTGSK